MGLTTTIKTVDFAKKLRDRMKKLQDRRVDELKKYDADVIAWKKALHTWIKLNGEKRIQAITKTEIKDERGYRNRPGFDANMFFHGAPQTPTYPSDKQLREIRNTLRQLGITGQTTIRLDTSEITRLLGDAEDQS